MQNNFKTIKIDKTTAEILSKINDIITDENYDIVLLAEIKAKLLNILNLKTGAIIKKIGQDQLEFYLEDSTPLSYFTNIEEIYI